MNATAPLRSTADRSRPLAYPSPAGKPSHLGLAESAPRRARRGGFFGALVCVGVIVATLMGQLGLSIAVSDGAYEIRALEVEQRDLLRVERVLSQNVDKLSSPQNLAENALRLGMVQNAQPATLTLSDHRIQGRLEANTTTAAGNLVPNAMLSNLPVVDAEGLMVGRDRANADSAAEKDAVQPVAWKKTLPAPDTH